MEDFIVGEEYSLVSIDSIIADTGGYRHYHGIKGNIGEDFLIMYSNDNPEWVFSFLLIQVGVSKGLNSYRLIYKYTG